MTNEEAIDCLRFYETQLCVRDCMAHRGDFGSCDSCEHMEMMDKGIEALEKQRYIDAKIEWLKTLNPYDVILVSDVLDWFEDAKVEDEGH